MGRSLCSTIHETGFLEFDTRYDYLIKQQTRVPELSLGRMVDDKAVF
jgi:hypothetical protein